MCNIRRDYFARHPLVTDKTWRETQKTLHLFSSIAYLSREDGSAEFYTSIVYVTCRPSPVFPLRVRAHVSYFSFFAFTSSHTLYILQWINELGVKVFRKKGLSPSPRSSPVPSREYVIWGLHLCMSRSKRGGIALSRSRVKRSVKVEGQKSSPLLRCAQMSCALPVKR